MTQRELITLAEFEAFVAQQSDRMYEYIGGEIVEVPSNPFVSKIAGLILTFFNLYLFDHPIGHVTGEAGGYQVAGERYAPDVAFISFQRQPQLAKSGYNPNAPDLAVEVISADSQAENDRLTIKLGNYLAAGTVVWIVRPEKKYVEVHRPGEPVSTYRVGDHLDGGAVLPGFTLPVSRIFAGIDD